MDIILDKSLVKNGIATFALKKNCKNRTVTVTLSLSSLCFLLAAMEKRVCDGTEDIQTVQNPYTDTSQLRITNMVYKAVYAIAHAIHNAVCQDTNATAQCDKFTRIESNKVR